MSGWIEKNIGKASCFRRPFFIFGKKPERWEITGAYF
jgi:hypothetical protein